MTTPSEQFTTHSPASISEEELVTQTVYECPFNVIETPPDANVEDQMAATEYSGALDFWQDAAEDVYEESDGDDT